VDATINRITDILSTSDFIVTGSVIRSVNTTLFRITLVNSTFVSILTTIVDRSVHASTVGGKVAIILSTIERIFAVVFNGLEFASSVLTTRVSTADRNGALVTSGTIERILIN